MQDDSIVCIGAKVSTYTFDDKTGEEVPLKTYVKGMRLSNYKNLQEKVKAIQEITRAVYWKMQELIGIEYSSITFQKIEGLEEKSNTSIRDNL